MDRTSKRYQGRLLIMFPPGAGKTTYASVVFPSYYLGRNAGHQLILTSYGDDLAIKMGRKTRSILRQPRYKSVFGTELSADSRAADQFVLTNGSTYMASGILGGITGNRGHGAIGDDLLKGREDAESETIREKVWDAVQDDLLTRLLPGGWLVMIGTRWHEADPIGKVLPDNWNGESGMVRGKDGLEWEVLCIQAQCETVTDPLGRKIGEYLAPEWFDPKGDGSHWAPFKRIPRTWNSLYQQRPRPIEGAFFQESDLLVNGKPVPLPRKIDYVYAIIDSAMKDGKTHDGLATMWFGRSKHNPTAFPLTVLKWDLRQIKGDSLRMWLPDVFRAGLELARRCEARLGFWGAWIEDKASGTMLLQNAEGGVKIFEADGRFTVRRDWKAVPIVSTLTAQGKKGKASNASSYVSAGMVKWCEEAYHHTCEYKGVTKNHALSQVLTFTPESKDTDPDDCLDDFSYGVALGLDPSRWTKKK